MAYALPKEKLIQPAHFDDDEGAASERDAIDYSIKITR